MRPYERDGATFAQGAFRWVLSNPNVDGHKKTLPVWRGSAAISNAEVIDSGHRVVLDMDSTEIPAYRRQEHSRRELRAISAPYPD